VAERVRFRCWKCRHRFSVARNRAGQTLQCDCGEGVRVPRCDHGNCRIRTIFGHLIEAVLCGAACALIGFAGVACASPILGLRPFGGGIFGLGTMVAAGCGLFGLLFGERVLDMVGTFVRARQRD
jgi:hypothetical protein